MRILAFSVNNKQKKFFQKIKKHIKCSVDVVYSKKIFSFSLKSLKYIKKADFTSPVELRVKDFYAKYSIPLPEIFVRIYYKISALLCFMRYFSVVDGGGYDKVVVWNGFMFRQAVLLEIAKLFDIKPVYVESAFLPNRIVVDEKGVNFFNSVPREKEFFLNYHNEKPLPKELIPRKPRNAKKFASLTKQPLPENYVFVPFQVDYDTQILLFSPWIRNMEHLFEVMEKISQKLKINFVFKEHPSSRKEYPHLHKKAENSRYLMFANAYPTQELIQKSDAVITVNSSVGIESLLFYKKVVTLGEAFYNIEGIVKHASNENELENILKHADSWQIDRGLIEKFLKYLYYGYLIPGNFSDYNEEQIKRIEGILCG